MKCYLREKEKKLAFGTNCENDFSDFRIGCNSRSKKVKINKTVSVNKTAGNVEMTRTPHVPCTALKQIMKMELQISGLVVGSLICNIYLAHVIEQPNFRIPNNYNEIFVLIFFNDSENTF